MANHPTGGDSRGSAGRSLFWRLSWLVGVALLLAGTFLPWLYSGTNAKNSYQLAGAGQRRLALPSWAEAVLGGWPFLGPIWAVLAVLFLLGLRRTSAALSILLAAVIGLMAVAVIALTAGLAGTYVSGALSGPIVTTIGVLGIAMGAGAELIGRRSIRR